MARIKPVIHNLIDSVDYEINKHTALTYRDRRPHRLAITAAIEDELPQVVMDHVARRVREELVKRGFLT